MAKRRLVAIATALGVLATAPPSVPDALAHSWYPRECCGDGDCAPADSVVHQDDGSWLVTAHGMVAVIPRDYPNWRRSPDAAVHVCIRKMRSGAEYVVCAFRAPGV
jgi:hypothetical protein